MNEEIILRGRLQLASKTKEEWDAVESGNLVLLDGEGIIVKQTNSTKVVFGDGTNKIKEVRSYITFGPDYGSLSIEAVDKKIIYQMNNNNPKEQCAKVEHSCLPNTISATGAFSIGSGSTASAPFSISLGRQTAATDSFAIALGWNTQSNGTASLTHGKDTQVHENFAHAEGLESIVYPGAVGGHAEGNKCQVYGKCGHAEGNGSIVRAVYGHADGQQCEVRGSYGQAIGVFSKTNALSALSGGYNSQANVPFGIAYGIQCRYDDQNTISKENAGQVLVGRGAKGDGAFIVGIGDIVWQTSAPDYPDWVRNSKNAFVVKWNGDSEFCRDVTIGQNAIINKKTTTDTLQVNQDANIVNKVSAKTLEISNDAVIKNKVSAKTLEVSNNATVQGNLTINGHVIASTAPKEDTHATNKFYVDTEINKVTKLINALRDNKETAELDSVMELVAWVGEHGQDAAEMSKSITDNTNNIDALSAKVEYLLVGPITITTFTINNANSALYYKGKTIDINLAWTTNHNPPKTLTLKQGNSIFTEVITVKNYTIKNVKVNSTYTLIVSDIMNKTATKNVTVNFGNDILYGVNSAETLNDISVLNKDLTAYKHITKTYTPNNQYIYYAYPEYMGDAKFNVGGFDGGFDYIKDIEYTNEEGYTETYKVYRSTNKLGGSIKVVVS